MIEAISTEDEIIIKVRYSGGYAANKILSKDFINRLNINLDDLIAIICKEYIEK